MVCDKLGMGTSVRALLEGENRLRLERAARAAGVELGLEVVSWKREEHVSVLLWELIPVCDQRLAAYQGGMQLTNLAVFPRIEAAATHITCTNGISRKSVSGG